jgi:hypothetical protein
MKLLFDDVMKAFFPELTEDALKSIKTTIASCCGTGAMKNTPIKNAVGGEAFKLFATAMKRVETDKPEGKEKEDVSDKKEDKPTKDEKAKGSGDAKEDKDSDKSVSKQNKKEKDVKESVYDTPYLRSVLNEITVDIDPANPTASVDKTKKAVRLAQTDSGKSRLITQQRMNARDERQQASKEKGSTAAIKKQIANQKEQLAALQARLAQMEKRDK